MQAAGPEVMTCREAETEHAGKDVVGRGSVEMAAPGHMWLRCCLQGSCLAILLEGWEKGLTSPAYRWVNSEVSLSTTS